MAARKKAAQPSLLSFFSRKATEEVTSSDPQEQTTQPEAPDVDAVEPLTSPVSQGLKSSAHDGGSSTPSVEATCDETNACEVGKQAAVFNASWIHDPPWLFYDNIKGGMFCKLCIKYNKRPLEKPVWNEQPCKRIRLDSVRKHDACHSHRDAVTLEANSKVAVSPLEKVQCPVSRNAMRQAFASMYYLCKHRIPHTTNFEPLLGLLSLLGLDVKAQITAGKNATYCSQRSIQEMVTCLSDVIEDKILCELRQSEHYALMFDETTDCATVEQLVIHCRYIFGGELRVKFLTMIDVLGNHEPHQGDERALALNATNIACAVEDFMNKKGLLFGALRGIGTDGAPVMTGKKGGAVKLLIDKQKALTAPHSFQAVGVHCAAHKLNLAALQAAKSIPYISKFKELLQQLYNFYASSSVRTAGLSAVQNILESEQRGGKIIEPSATRWLSVGGSCTAIRNNLSAIIISLSREAEQRSDIRAAGLLKFVTNAKFVGTLLMMCDLLPAIDRLSRTLQTSSLQVDLIQGLIKSCIKTLETQSNIQTKVKDFCVSHDIEVTITEESEQWLHNTKRAFVKKLLENIQDRFQDHPILASYSTVFDRSSYKQMVGGNGIEVVSALQRLCPTLGKPYTEDMLAEWIAFANFVLECDRVQKLTAADFLLFVAHDMKELFPIMACLAGSYLVLPPHTVDCERDFSALKLIKTQLRNRLKEKSLDCLIRIACEGPDVDTYPYEEVVEKWAKSKNRRLKV